MKNIHDDADHIQLASTERPDSTVRIDEPAIYETRADAEATYDGLTAADLVVQRAVRECLERLERLGRLSAAGLS